jgi:hypothetical protein
VNEQLSQFTALMRTILLHRAQGRAHDAMARLVGLERPRGFPESDWLNAIHVLAYGPRGHPATTLRFVEMALRRFDEVLTVSTYEAFPNRLYGSFTSNHIERLVRHKGTLYRTTAERADDYSWIGLEVVSAPLPWEPSDLDKTETQVVRFLPFRVREATGGPIMSGTVPEMPSGFPPEVSMGYVPGTGVLYEVLLVATAVSLTVPPSYLRADASARNADPFGAQLCPDAGYDGSNVFPLYLDSGRRFREFEARLDDVLAAGVKAEIKLEDL